MRHLTSPQNLQVSYAAKSAKIFKGKSPKTGKTFKGKSAKGSSSTADTKSGKGSKNADKGHEGTSDAKAFKVGSTSGDHSKSDKFGTADAKAKKVGKSSGGGGGEIAPPAGILGIAASFDSISASLDLVADEEEEVTSKMSKEKGGVYVKPKSDM